MRVFPYKRFLGGTGKYICDCKTLVFSTGGVGGCVLRAALPTNTDGLYGGESGESAVAWTTSYGEGRITYFPVDYSRLQDGVEMS